MMQTPGAYVYQTSYGIYSFDRSASFIFSLQTSSGVILSKGSFFFVRTGQAPLTPGLSTVLVASDTQYVTRYEVILNNLIVGSLQLQVDFQASSRPKFSIQFSETSNWTLGHFNIVWTTFTADQWARSSGRPPLAISTLSSVQQFAGSSRVDVGPSGDPSTWTDWLTTDWSDAPGGVLETGPLVLAGLRGTGHEIVFPADQATIDPTQVTTSNVNTATSFSTQRKLAYYAGRYYMFYYSGSSIQMKSSTDQVTWTAGFVEGGGTCWGGAIGYNFDLAQSGSTIALVWLYYNSSSTGDHTTALYFKPGVIFDGDISWGSCVKVASFVSQPYSWPPSVTIGSDGTYWVGGIWYDANLNYNVWIYKSTDGSTFTLSTNYLTSNSASRDEALQLIPLTTGRVMSLTSHYYDSTVRWRVWNPLATNGGSWSATQSLSMNFQINTPKWNLMSATSTPDGNVHMVFEQFTTTYQIVYSFYNSTTAQWTVGPSLYSCSSQCLYPTISSDSLGNLYAFWMALSSGVPTYLIYSTKIKGQSWSAASQPFGSGTNIQNANWLSSSRTSTKEVLLTWTLNTTSPYKIFLGTIPLPSGIASGPPLRPWSRIGLATNEQYFTQNGEYLSPGNGLLTVSQTDISVQGRNGLSLAITRVYVQPFTLLQGSPINYETTPYASLGYGWQLNLPWVGSQYLHFLNGEMFPIVYANSTNTTNSTYSVTVWSFENHQTEDFLFARTNTTNLSSHTSTITFRLTTKDGTVYNLNNIGSISSLADRTGQNQISFSYTGTLLSSITDTVGRTATLKYNGSNQLANVTYGGQTVRYGYSGSNLVTVTDAVGRVITLKYNGVSAWLLTGVVYTAGGNSTYTYGSMPVGTDAINYYVTLQNVDNPGTIVKTSSFSYNITDGEVTSTVVKQSDGFNVQGFTNYVFNAKANSLTRTVLNGTQVQMLKTQFWFDPLTGRSVQQDIFTGTSIGRSFYNSQFYDNWGNVIYTRDNTGHESYQSFANTNTQWTFQSPGSMSTTTNGRVFYDDFNGPTLNTTAWATGGSGIQLVRTVTGSLLKLQLASSTQGTTQSNWVRSSATYGYPFYAEVQMMKGAGDGTGSAEFILSPQQTGSTGNPFQNNDALRLLVTDGPTYEVLKIVGGVTTTVWSSGNRGTHSLDWKIILTDRNTLKVWVNLGLSQGYQELYSTTSLGLSTSFTPSYAYLVFENPSTTTYSGTFDYVGLSSSNTVTLTNLQANQKVEAYDWNNVLQASGTVASGQTNLSLNLTQFPFPYGYFKIYELDGRTVQFTSATREIWGGSTYAYTSPFRSGADQRTSTGFLQNSSKYVDESLPTGAVTHSDGGDSWVWATGLVVPTIGDEAPSLESVHVSQVVSGTHEHYFNSSSQVLAATSGYYLIQYVYIPSNAVPSEIMLQFHTQGGTWEHRAYWGSNLITACGTTGATCGTNGTPSRLPMGVLPTVRNAWVELIVKTDDVGVNGLNVDGWAYTLYNGGAYWDESDLASSSIQTVTMNNLLVGQKVELYNSTGTLKASATVASGQTSVTLNVYSVGINTFPLSGYMKVYSSSGGLQYSSPLMTDIWGGDVYSYNQPVFSNSFNPGSMSSSLHSQRMGTAQYQNATSTPEEDYSNYDSVGDLLQDLLRHNGSPLTTTNTYDSYGNMLSSINPSNEKTYNTYSTTYQRAYLTNATRVLSSSVNVTTSYTYNFTTGMALTVKDPMGNVTSYQYDSIDRTTIVKWATVGGVSANMTFLFQDSDNSFGIKNEKANYTDVDYDGQNRLTQLSSYKGALYTSPIVSQQNYTYDWQGQMKTSQDPTGNVTTYSYDYLGRLSKVTNPGGSIRTISYDDVNLIQMNYDENGHRTDYLYDALHRLIVAREYYSPTNYYLTSYSYNGVGDLAKKVDAKSQTTTYSYDDLNRLVLTVYPDGFNETRSYDSIRNLISKKDPNGKTVNYGYDALNRVMNVTYPDSTKATYTYDKNGNKLSLSYLGNSATFTYDSRNRETGETWTIGGSQYTLSYAYDQVGNIASITYPDATKVNYTIDPLNRATTVKSGSTTLAAINYRPDSKIANITYGNNVVTTYQYDSRGRPTEIKVQGQTTLLDLNYGFDGVGNVISIGSESYSYDFLNRLTTATGPWGTVKYGYDGVGNRLWLYQSPTNTTYVYGLYDRLTSVGSTTYTYDNNGNRLTQVSGGTTTKYNYDFENRMISVSQGASTLGNYTYSPFGQRIQKIESGVATTYVNYGVDVLYEKVGTTVNDYVLVGNMVLSKLTGSNTYYFHQDFTGSTRLVTIGSNTNFSSNFQPFGAQYGASGTDPTYKYTGKPQDPATSLYYYGARYYDTAIGRFLSRDPATAPFGSSQSSCRYSYVRNNPETLTDPSGACVSHYWLASQLVLIPASLMGLYWLQWSMPFIWAGLVGYMLVFVVPGAAWYIANGDYWGLFWNVVIRGSWQVIWTIGKYMGWWGWLSFAGKIASNTWWIPLVITFGSFFVWLMYYYVSPPYQYQLCPW